MIEQKEVKSISNCIACHKDANEGTYRERNIHIQILVKGRMTNNHAKIIYLGTTN